MNQDRKYVFVAVCAVLGFMAYSTQRNSRREMEQRVANLDIKTRTLNGCAEYTAGLVPLVEGFKKPGECIEWYAVAGADPKKPEFAMVFRNGGEPNRDWEAMAQQPIVIIADGVRHDMKPFQAHSSDDGNSITMVSVNGSRSVLAAIVDAGAVEIEFSGKRYGMTVKGRTNCKELMRLSESSRKGLR